MIRVIVYTAPWCAPCKPVARALAELAPAFPQLAFAEIDLDASPRPGVLALPTVVVERDGEEVRRVEGAQPRRAYERLLAEVVETVE